MSYILNSTSERLQPIMKNVNSFLWFIMIMYYYDLQKYDFPGKN